MTLPKSLVTDVIVPTDRRFEAVRSTYFRGGAPGVVFQPTNAFEVAESLAFVRQSQLPLGLRSGGHGIRGRSTNWGGAVLDLSRMAKVKVLDPSTRRVAIEPGARWMEVAAALAPFGWAISSGDDGRVGVGGLATAAGVGLLGRTHGLTIDRLRAVELVLADGTSVRASENENNDLFWAMRGAGSAFGVVTSFEFEALEVTNVGWAQLVLDVGNTEEFLVAWGAAVEGSPRDLTSFLILGPHRRDRSTVAFVNVLVDSDNLGTVEDRVRPLLQLAPVLARRIEVVPYASLMAKGPREGQHGQGEPISRSGSIRHFTRDVAGSIAQVLRQGSVSFFQVRSMGGAISDVPTEATAFGSRDANFEVTVAGTSRDGLDREWDRLGPLFSGLVITFDTDLRPGRVHDAFGPRTLERLTGLKHRYDPTNLFRDHLDLVAAQKG